MEEFGSASGSSWVEVQAVVSHKVEAILVFGRKLSPYLPDLNEAKLLSFSDEQRVMSLSDIYRSMRFVSLGSNRHTVDMCRNAMPSHLKVPDIIDFKDPVVQIPVVGDILCKNLGACPMTLLESAIFGALTQLGSLEDRDQQRFMNNFQYDSFRNEVTCVLESARVRFSFEDKLGSAKAFVFEVFR